MRFACWLLSLLSLALVAGPADGAVPDVKWLFPAGAARGTTTSVKFGGALGTVPVSVWCDREGVEVSAAEDGKSLNVTVSADAVPGVCWLRVYNTEGASTPRPFVIGTLPDVAESEANNATSEAQTLESRNVVVNGTLGKSGDVDCYAVDLKKGQTFVASCVSRRLLHSPADMVMQLVSPAGYVLEQNEDARGFDPEIVFGVPADGTYFVRVFAFPATPNSTIGFAGGADYIYRLTLTRGAFVNDVVPLAVQRGSETAFGLRGWNIPAEMKVAGVPTQDGFVNAFHQDVANSFAVPVGESPVVVEDRGAERIPLSLPSRVSGCIESSGDRDTYVFQAKKGDKLTFRVDARSFAFPLDPVIELNDADGKRLSRVDDPSRDVFDATLNFTIRTDGEHSLTVADLFGHGGERYAYLLTAGPTEEDFSLTVAADKFTLKPGTPLKIPVTIGRSNGFAGEVSVAVSGLPEGVTCEAMVAKAKEKSAELVLTAEGAVSLNEPVRVVGTGKVGEESIERTASATLAGTTAKSEALWLTVLAPEEKKPAADEKSAEKPDEKK